MKVARRRRSAAAKAAAEISRNVSMRDGESDGSGSERDSQLDEDASSSEEEYDDDSTADAPAPKRRKPQAKPKGKGVAARPRRGAAAKLHAKASAKRSRGVFEWHGESEEDEDPDARRPSPATRKRGRKRPPASKEAATRGKKASNPTGKGGGFKANDGLWNERFKQLQAYKEVHGDCNVLTNSGQLGEWVASQRRRKGKLSDQRIGRLEQIGFEWVVARGLKPKDSQWNERFEQLQSYRAEHGDCNVRQKYTTEDGMKLGSWVRSQRMHRGKLSEERRERLEQIGSEWKSKYARWNERLKQLKAFRAEYGHCNVPYRYASNPQLGMWVRNQRRRKGKLSHERIQLLGEIGFIWSASKGGKPDDEGWKKQYEQLRAYKAEHEHCNVPQRYAKKLGRWVKKQRDAYKSGKLSAERRERLEQIEFSWSLQRGQRSDLTYVSESDGEEPASEENGSDAHSESADEDASPPSEVRVESREERLMSMREKREKALRRDSSALAESSPEAEAVERAETGDLQEEVVAEATGPDGELLEQGDSDDEEFGGDGHSVLVEDANGGMNSEALEAMKLVHSRQMEEIEAAHQKDLETVQASAEGEYNAKVEAMKLAHSQQTEAMKAAHRADLEKERDSHSRQIATMKASFLSKLRQLRELATSLWQRRSDQLARIEQAHRNTLTAAEKRYREDLEKATRAWKIRHERKMKEMRRQHDLQKNMLLQELEEALSGTAPREKKRTPNRATRKKTSVLETCSMSSGAR